HSAAAAVRRHRGVLRVELRKAAGPAGAQRRGPGNTPAPERGRPDALEAGKPADPIRHSEDPQGMRGSSPRCTQGVIEGGRQLLAGDFAKAFSKLAQKMILRL